MVVCCFQERIRGVKSLFRDESQTEFIIATIPAQLGIAESRRLLATLQAEQIPCKRIIVNQVGPCLVWKSALVWRILIVGLWPTWLAPFAKTVRRVLCRTI
eukprot:GHUV01052480.1.p2 GENE.GHUV01052480.1~~GHUV01052480.1.p2  ORF type:complete len:101 (-),score=2.32 GHUV01052480.1:111-413(-)